MPTPAFADGTVVSSTDLLYTVSPPRCHVYQGTTGTACADSTLTLLSFDTSMYVTDSMWSAGTNPSRVTINTDGLYIVTVFTALPAATYTAHNLNLRKNSGGSPTGGTSIRTHPVGAVNANRWTCEVQLVAGEYLELFLFQTSGASRTTATGGQSTGMNVRRVAYQ